MRAAILDGGDPSLRGLTCEVGSRRCWSTGARCVYVYGGVGQIVPLWAL